LSRRRGDRLRSRSPILVRLREGRRKCWCPIDQPRCQRRLATGDT
jgi:hypothetical protein